MSNDTYAEVWGRVLLRCPTMSPKLAQDFVINAFRRLAEVRRWSWLTKFNQFIAPAAYNTGTVTVTLNSTTVTGSGTTFTAAMVGRQFKVGTSSPIYTIAQYTSATSIELDLVYGGTTTAGASYIIYQSYFTVPSDFHQFISLWDPSFNWQLFLDINQSEINIWDAQRANTGNAFCVSFRGYSNSQVGVVSTTLQVVGTGPDPTSGGTFTGPNDAIFTVEITTGGTAGTAVYKWKKDDGSYTSGVATNGAATAQTLQDGVTVLFPLVSVYVVGDVFVIRCQAIPNAGLPIYELWPNQQSAHVYPFLYEMRAADLDDVNAVLPRYIRGDVLVEMACEDVALWPGPSTDKPNPYFSITGAKYHHDRAEKMIQVLEVQDDNVWMQDLTYAYPSMSWAFATPLGDSAWLQNHAI